MLLSATSDLVKGLEWLLIAAIVVGILALVSKKD